MGLVSLKHVESSWTRDRTCVPCLGILNHWTTGKSCLTIILIILLTLGFCWTFWICRFIIASSLECFWLLFFQSSFPSEIPVTSILGHLKLAYLLLMPISACCFFLILFFSSLITDSKGEKYSKRYTQGSVTPGFLLPCSHCHFLPIGFHTFFY